jgi:hypothetical protein
MHGNSEIMKKASLGRVTPFIQAACNHYGILQLRWTCYDLSPRFAYRTSVSVEVGERKRQGFRKFKRDSKACHKTASDSKFTTSYVLLLQLAHRCAGITHSDCSKSADIQTVEYNFICRGRYISPFTNATCMICHEILPLRPSTLAWQPVASRTTSPLRPQYGSSS